MPSPFRIGEHIGNLENKGTPYVLIETSFLSNFSKPAAALKALKFVENAVRKNGATPISLGMIDGEVVIGLNMEEMKTLCAERKPQLCCNRNNLSHYCTQKATAFLSPSAAVHISNLYGVPTILSSEIEGVPIDYRQRTPVGHDLTSLTSSNSILVSMGFHPYQDIQKSLNYLKENHVNVFTLDSTVIPSTVGSASMVNSPSNFATEKELIDAIVSSYSSHSDVVFIKPHSYFTQDDLQQTLVSIHQHLSQKHISDSHLLRLTQKHLYRISSIPIHKAFYETMERLAAVSAHAAVAVGRLGRNAAMAPQPKRSHLASSPTYSIFSIGRKQIRDSEWVLLDMMRDVLHNEKDVMRSTVATTIQSMMNSAVRHPATANVFEKPINFSNHSNVSFHFLNKGPPLPRPKSGASVFVTANTLENVAIATDGSMSGGNGSFSSSSNPVSSLANGSGSSITSENGHGNGVLKETWTAAGSRGYRVYCIYASLTREAPPLRISIRSDDLAGRRLGELSREMGDMEYGTTVVSGRHTPEGMVVLSEKGEVIRHCVDDELMMQAGDGFVVKHNAMIENAGLVVMDDGVNDSVLCTICKTCGNRGIPLFFDMAECDDISKVLRNNVLKCAQWSVQSPESLCRVESVLSNHDSLSAWQRLSTNTEWLRESETASFVTPQSIIDILSSPLSLLLKEMKESSPLLSRHILLTLPPFGVCVINNDENESKSSTSMNLLLTPDHHGPFADVAFESGFLWGIMNQYPLDLSMSLGLITQVQVNQSNTLLGKSLHNSLFANQIMKYMTGINSFDIF
ncbi:hypothetical protein WA538_003575 [Blastocystis sp. DL]